MNLVAQFDRSGIGGTCRYLLRKGTTLEADMVADLGETNAGEPAVAIDFFTWGITTYPSDRVMCVLWNHGSGIDEADVYARARAMASIQGRLTRGGTPPVTRQLARAIASSGLSRSLFSTTVETAIGTRGIAYDDASRDFLDNDELSQVLARVVENTGRTIDVLGFDACLMNMVEISYQLRHSASYIVGSEETEPGNGWPYEKVATAARGRAATPAKLAAAVVSTYVASYADDPNEDRVTQSAVDLGTVEALVAAIDGMAKVCIEKLDEPAEYGAFSAAVTRALRFHTRDFVDLGDLCRQLASRSADSEIAAATSPVLSALDRHVIAKGHKGDAVSRATGTGIYFPVVEDATVA